MSRHTIRNPREIRLILRGCFHKFNLRLITRLVKICCFLVTVLVYVLIEFFSK